jgi:hypothetical protein
MNPVISFSSVAVAGFGAWGKWNFCLIIGFGSEMAAVSAKKS